MRAARQQQGLSLVEVTIMLLVLMLLTSVLAPSIYDFVFDAQRVKVKEDCEAIGISIARLMRDVGPCLQIDATVGCTDVNRADVLTGDGNFPPLFGEGDITNPWASFMNQHKWLSAGTGNIVTSNADTLENQLVTNHPRYPAPTTWVGGGWYPIPVNGLGYRGAYIAPPIGPDPWGDAYQVNTGFLAVANNVGTPPFTGQGQKYGYWDVDVFCISGGPNKQLDTAFGGVDAAHPDVQRRADDVVFVIQGSTR